MTAGQPDRLDHIEASLDTNNQRMTRIETTLETVVQSLSKLDTDVKGLSERVDRTNDRVEIYQKASTQVVNLAFGLLATASAAIIIPVLLRR